MRELEYSIKLPGDSYIISNKGKTVTLNIGDTLLEGKDLALTVIGFDDKDGYIGFRVKGIALSFSYGFVNKSIREGHWVKQKELQPEFEF